jgi:hypothetical protein
MNSQKQEDGTMEAGEAVSFARDLWRKITDTGFNAMSKNDFYDYVLYLFNKHSKTQFLDNGSNYDNSILLRVTEQKLKSTQQNIYLKYETPEEKDHILPNFINKIMEDRISLELSQDTYTFVLDHLPTRNYLEALMKRSRNTTFDYALNREKVSLGVKDFYDLLKTVVTEICKDRDEDLGEVQRRIEKMEKDEQIRSLVAALLGSAAGLAADLVPVGVPQLMKFCKAFLRR